MCINAIYDLDHCGGFELTFSLPVSAFAGSLYFWWWIWYLLSHFWFIFIYFFSPYPFTLPPGQQEDEEDARGGTAGKERAGEDCEESSEEHEWPDLGRNKPLRFVSDTEGWD